MRIRNVNQRLLKKLIWECGGYAKAALHVGKSKTLLSGLVNDSYRREVKETTLNQISSGFGVEHEELFPLVGASAEKAS